MVLFTEIGNTGGGLVSKEDAKFSLWDSEFEMVVEHLRDFCQEIGKK